MNTIKSINDPDSQTNTQPVNTSLYRTKELDYDVRRKPETDRSCVKCNKDIDPLSHARVVHVVEGGISVLHPEDKAKYSAAGLSGSSSDCGAFLIGMNCARALGLEWSVKE